MNETMKCGLCGMPIKADVDFWELDGFFGAVHSSCWVEYAAENFGYYSDDEEWDWDEDEDDRDYEL